MNKFYDYRGITKEDNVALLKAIITEIELTIDKQNRVYNEAEVYIADVVETPENGILFEINGWKIYKVLEKHWGEWGVDESTCNLSMIEIEELAKGWGVELDSLLGQVKIEITNDCLNK